MKILTVIGSADAAGAERHVEAVVRSVRGEHIVIALAPGPMLASWQAAGARVEICPAAGKFPFAAVPLVRRAIASHAPEIVHAHTPKANLIASLALSRGGPPFVITIHGSHRQFASARWTPSVVYLWSDRRAARRARAVICVCAADRRELAGVGFPSDRLELIPNGVPDHEGWPLTRPEDAPRTIAWAGRFSAEKRPNLALAVASRLRSHPRLAGFRMLGDGPLRPSIARRASAIGVRLEPPRPGLASLWSEADILLNTSSTEGMSLAVLEAMAAGVPVVATAVGGTAEAVGNGGITVPGGGSDSVVIANLSAAVRALIENPAAYRAAAAAARARYEAEFRVEIMGSRLEELYRRLAR